MIHANLIIAASIIEASLPKDIQSESIDVKHLVVARMGIDDARELVKLSASRSFGGGSRYFVIQTKSITVEAQNALLKLFEEPGADTIFYLIIPNESLLLPTLRSRLMVTNVAKRKEDGLAEAFIAMDYAGRLEYIANLAKKNPDDLSTLFTSLAYNHDLTNPDVKQSLSLVAKYVYNRGASKKMLLEELALGLGGRT